MPRNPKGLAISRRMAAVVHLLRSKHQRDLFHTNRLKRATLEEAIRHRVAGHWQPMLAPVAFNPRNGFSKMTVRGTGSDQQRHLHSTQSPRSLRGLWISAAFFQQLPRCLVDAEFLNFKCSTRQCAVVGRFSSSSRMVKESCPCGSVWEESCMYMKADHFGIIWECRNALGGSIKSNGTSVIGWVPSSVILAHNRQWQCYKFLKRYHKSKRP